MNVLKGWRNNMTDVPTAAVDKPLSRQAQAAIEAHYVEVTELRDQRDKALADLERAKALCTQATHQIHGLNDQVSDLKGRCTTYQIERDEAVAKLAKLEGKMSHHVATLRASMENLLSPNAPRQRVADDAEAPVLEMKHLVRGGYQAPAGGTKPAAPTTGSGVVTTGAKS